MKHLLKKYYEKYTDIRWNIGFFNFKVETLFSDESWKIQWMRHDYKDRWFADPFILKVTDIEIWVLAEEYNDPVKRGRISRLIIDRRTFRLKNLDPVLELDSHLSFPAIYRIGQYVYFYPENSVTGQLSLYRYDIDQNIAVFDRILADLPLTDAVISTIFKESYLFSTKLPTQNQNVMGVYRAENPEEKYGHLYDVTFADCVARNAGNILQLENRFFRVAQDCNQGYGKGIVFQEILLKKERFLFKEIKRVYPDSWIYHLGMHTFNTCEDMAVVDGRGYRLPFTGHILQALRSILR